MALHSNPLWMFMFINKLFLLKITISYKWQTKIKYGSKKSQGPVKLNNMLSRLISIEKDYKINLLFCGIL